MHPRNPYKNTPDFSGLAEFFPALKPFLSLSPSGNPTLDFRNPNAQIALTQALLKRDFNITLSLSDQRLCPPVPNRLNYVLWIQDILFPYNEIVPDKKIKGLDVGTGASAIYPLLACSLPKAGNWSFVGTEIDPLSASFASRNVEANNLQSRIAIWPIQELSNADPPTESIHWPTPILAPLIDDPESRFDFTMCNPPFYGSTLEMENSAKGKELPPVAVCTGTETEMITPGGETAFVLQMLHESADEDCRGRCRWFTSMLGKLASVGEVVGELRRHNIDNYALTQFIQGTTRRWAVAWSFGDERLPDAVARPSSSSLSSYLPAPTTLRKSFPLVHQTNGSSPPCSDRLKTALSHVLTAIPGVVVKAVSRDSPDVAVDQPWKFDIQANENTWSRAARRKRKRSLSLSHGRTERPPPLDPGASPEAVTSPRVDNHPTRGRPHNTALHCWIYAVLAPSEHLSHTAQKSIGETLEIQWVRGKDRAMFEGFWSHVCRKVTERLGTP